MHQKKKIILSVTNDLTTDQRLHKVCTSLEENGFDVTLVGRRLPYSQKVKRKYKIKRFKLPFHNGALFYASYNLRLFFYLLFTKADCFLANDLDTLLANYWAAKIKRKPLVYDSHELFTEVPELINRPKIQRIWQRIEGYILPKIKHAYTVCYSISEHYKSLYGIEMEVIRNFPKKTEQQVVQKRNYLIYQGVLNVDRGLEELIAAMQFVDGYILILAGGGDIELALNHLVRKLKLKNKVKFLGRLPLETLQQYTQKSQVGFSLEKNVGLNYEYALPNKVFDYLNAGVPVIYSDLKEVKSTLADFEVGEELRSYEAAEMGKQITDFLENPNYSTWVKNCNEASKIFNWENEERKLVKLFKDMV